MRLDGRQLLLALALSAALTVRALAALPAAYDFTGQWAGTAPDPSGSLTLTADFASTTSPRRFTGDAVLEDGGGDRISCTFNATYRRRLTLHLRCTPGGRKTATLHFDAATQTIAAAFTVGHRHPRLARFTLTRTY